MIDSATGAARAVRDRVLTCLWREGVLAHEIDRSGPQLRLWLRGPNGLIAAETTRLLGFGRLGPIESCVASEHGRAPVALEGPTELLDWVTKILGTDALGARVTSLRDELENSVANLTLAIDASFQHRKLLTAQGVDDLHGWLQTFTNDDERRHALEESVIHGHAVHPGTKARMGMSEAESIRYAPELVPLRDPLYTPRFHFVALSRSNAQTAGRDIHACWEALWPGIAGKAANKLGAQARELSAYVIIPMHPWQYEHKLALIKRALPEAHSLIDLSMDAPFRPQLALRTVEPATDDIPEYHVKLAIGVLTTSAERTISPMSIHNGPRIARAVCMLARDARVPVRILDEVASAGIDPKTCTGGRDTARHLGVIVRENPSFVRSKNAVPDVGRHWLAAALTSPSPFSRRSFAAEWIHAQRGAKSTADAAQRFFEAYCRALIVPTAQLLARYGVALEAHGQNSLIDIDADGLPSGLTIRDLGGVRIHTSRLARSGIQLDFAEESATCTNDLHEVHTKFSHCVFQTHLTDLIETIERDFPGALRAPWAYVRSTLEQAIRTTEGAVDAEGDLRALLAPIVDAKCLLRMRLAGEYSKYTYAPVDNPLAG